MAWSPRRTFSPRRNILRDCLPGVLPAGRFVSLPSLGCEFGQSAALRSASGVCAFFAFRQHHPFLQRAYGPRCVFPGDAVLCRHSRSGRSYGRYHLPDSLFHLCAIRCFHFRGNGIAPRSRWRGFARAPHAHGARSKIEPRAQSFRPQRDCWIHPPGRRAVFLFPTLHSRVSGPGQFQPFAHVRFHGRCRTWADRRDQEEFHCRHARADGKADWI